MHIVAGEPHSISVLELRLEFELRERERTRGSVLIKVPQMLYDQKKKSKPDPLLSIVQLTHLPISTLNPSEVWSASSKVVGW